MYESTKKKNPTELIIEKFQHVIASKLCKKIPKCRRDCSHGFLCLFVIESV